MPVAVDKEAAYPQRTIARTAPCRIRECASRVKDRGLGEKAGNGKGCRYGWRENGDGVRADQREKINQGLLIYENYKENIYRQNIL